jgi:hypothetical protein
MFTHLNATGDVFTGVWEQTKLMQHARDYTWVALTALQMEVTFTHASPR